MDDKIKVSLEVDTSKAEKDVSNFQSKINNMVENIKSKFNTKLDIKVGKIKELGDAVNKVKEIKEAMADAIEAGDGAAFFNLKKNLNDSLLSVGKLGKELGFSENELRQFIGADLKNMNTKLKESHKHVGLLGSLFAKIGRQISRQVFTQIASLLNPINGIRKVLTYITDVVNPRLGATFRNIGENLIEYFATSPIFDHLIHGAIMLIYLLQQIFNVFARIFQWGEMDLFKTSMKTGKKLQKMQQQMLAGFDEINDIGSSNQQDQLDATPLALGELISEDEKKKLDEIAEKFNNIGKIIKDIVDWVKKFWKEILIAIAVIAVLTLAIKGISLIKGKGTGLDELNKGIGNLANSAGKALEIIAILSGLALVILAISQLVEAFKDNSSSLGAVLAVLSVTFAGIAVIMLAVAKLGPQMTAGLVPFLVVIAAIIGVLLVMAETLPTILDAVGKFINEVAPPLVTILTTIFIGIENIIKSIGDVLIPLVKELGNVFKTIFDGVAKVINTVGNNIVNILDAVSRNIDNILNSIINFINKLGPAINNFTDEIIKAATKVFNFLTKGFETIVNNGVTAINWLFSPLRKVGNFILEKVGLGDFKFNPISNMPKLARLNTGTNYVPNDQLAYIHQGEAVIPKKFNDREFFGGTNEETNTLLETLIDRIDNIDFSPYTTVKDVGKAAVEYIKETSRQTGRSMI